MTGETRPRVLICDDSQTYAAALQRLIEHDGELDVVAVARSAEDAITAVGRLHPDLVTMDIELPGMSGLEAVERIMGIAPVPILVLSGHLAADAVDSAAALAAGALDALPKQSVDLLHPAGEAADAFRRRLAMLSKTRVIRHPRGRRRFPPLSQSEVIAPRPARAIGICSSMGGPHALLDVLTELPASFPVPILVAQHMAAGFAEGLARWLDSSVPLEVQIARHGDEIGAGVWIAPDEAHLMLDAAMRAVLRPPAPADTNIPSGDVLLMSLASALGRDSVAIVLTGMGRDGAAGIAAVKAAGGFTIAQDEATSAIYGMPRAAAEQGVDRILPLGAIPRELCALAPQAAAR